MTSAHPRPSRPDESAWRVTTDQAPTLATPTDASPDWLRDAVGIETEALTLASLTVAFRALAEMTRIAREHLADPLAREMMRSCARVGHVQLMQLGRILAPDSGLFTTEKRENHE